MALTSLSVTTAATVDGRALARNGSVTLDTFTRSRCRTGPSPTPTTTSATRSVTATTSATVSAATSTAPLAVTGSPTGALLTVAALLMTAGFATLLVSRRLGTARHRR